MRWNALFDDLEAQLAAARGVAIESEIAETVRAEHAAHGLADRLRANTGNELRLMLRGGVRLDGMLGRVGAGWLSMELPPGGVLVPERALVSVEGLRRGLKAEPPGPLVRVSLASALRAVARDRAHVECQLDGAGAGGISGIIDVVGKDYLELSQGRGDSGWGAAARGSSLIPFSAILSVRG